MFGDCPVLQIAHALGQHKIRLFRFYLMQEDGGFTPLLRRRIFNVRVRCGVFWVIIEVAYEDDTFSFIGFVDDVACLFELSMPSTSDDGDNNITRETAASYAMCCIVAGTEFSDFARYAGILMPLAAQMIAASSEAALSIRTPFIGRPELRKCGQFIIGAHYSTYRSGAFYVDIKAAYPSALSSIADDNDSLTPIATIFKDLFALRSDPRLVDVKRISNVSTGYLRCGSSRHGFPARVGGFFDDVYFAMTHIIRRHMVHLLGSVCPIFCYVDSICVQKKDAPAIMDRMALSPFSFSTQDYRRVYVVNAAVYTVETMTGNYIIKGCSQEAKDTLMPLLVESKMFDKPLRVLPASIASTLAQYHHTLSHPKSSSTVLYCPFVQEATPRPAFGRLKTCPLCRTLLI